MKKMSPKKQKGLIVAGLLLLCVAIVVGIFSFSGKAKNISEVPIATQPTDNAVHMDEIKDTTTPIPIQRTVTEVSPTIIESDTEFEATTKSNNIQLTEALEKPEPPEKPETALSTEKPHEKPKDKELTNPDKKPQTTVKPVEPDKPKGKTPQGGETNDKGETYVPGFGWVKDSGANVGEKSDSDGDWNKQIGDMN
ncbi:MAG: hypothetical protein BWY74_04207 [Firmicutes bacterium ADurb.Bin419]|nr:MAG: hypothetical protein BWY74_04207 [Firmicutes bacterium ADurb.Bin419]